MNQSNNSSQTQSQQGVSSSQSQTPSYQVNARRKQYGKQLLSGKTTQNKSKSDGKYVKTV